MDIGSTKIMTQGLRLSKRYWLLLTEIAFEVFDICGKEPLIEIALELEKIALEDEYL